MFIIKTALKNIREKWLIYSVLGLLFIMLSAFICSSFSAYIYSAENFDNTRRELGTYVYLKNVGESVYKIIDNNNNIIGTHKGYTVLDDLKWYNSFGKDAGLSGYEARSVLTLLNPDGYEPTTRIHGFTDDFEMSIGGKTLEYSVFQQRYKDIISKHKYSIKNNMQRIGIYEFDPDYENALDSKVNEFAVKNNVRGKMPENDSEILINNELLQMFDGAKVGDTLCFKYTTADNQAFEKEYLITGTISDDFFYTNAMRYYTTLHSNLKYEAYVKSQVKCTEIRQEVYRKNSPGSVPVSG